ncbi:hypothetical protein FHR92_001832 [Fontibacillus solani]|uniref:Uncharacterized protein n=1 Tax=Fontibacillus solani TaxID=1572857 RepID=A0A7W3SSB2_9BACL|nr:hypothetical protein [Fontibacillus solani]MBA9085366.1 hypothetical protein [Fontibacillus solani]
MRASASLFNIIFKIIATAGAAAPLTPVSAAAYHCGECLNEAA